MDGFGMLKGYAERSGRLWSSVWVWLPHKYKGMDKVRTKAMKWTYIYGYASFGVGVLFLLGLIGFTWVALCKIRQRLSR
jgi:hypothetical protein